MFFSSFLLRRPVWPHPFLTANFLVFNAKFYNHWCCSAVWLPCKVWYGCICWKLLISPLTASFCGWAINTPLTSCERILCTLLHLLVLVWASIHVLHLLRRVGESSCMCCNQPSATPALLGMIRPRLLQRCPWGRGEHNLLEGPVDRSRDNTLAELYLVLYSHSTLPNSIRTIVRILCTFVINLIPKTVTRLSTTCILDIWNNKITGPYMYLSHIHAQTWQCLV